MCGIAGIVLQPNHSPIDLTPPLQRMARAMVHRGPDDEGIWLTSDQQVALATRRLAIRDRSSAGHMPMSSTDGLVTLTYNGEIYNADALRAELRHAGHTLHSNSDSEVILLGYLLWGSGVVTRLRGMFAFAIVDQRPTAAYPGGRLFLARDPLGVKPLYYAWTGECLLFASEVKALLASILVGREVSPAGLSGYLHLGAVPNPWTIYRDIQALEPAAYIEIDLRQPGHVTPTVYWHLRQTPTESTLNREQTVAQVREQLLDAVRVRLVSDVPLGAFLSGGLDSSAVVALMRQVSNGPIRTCSLVFEEAAYSEAHYARAMAAHVGADHYERMLTAADLLAEFENIVNALDQPSVDGVNTYFVAQTARQAGLTVALSGLGGDELFGGYPETFQKLPELYRKMQMVQKLTKLAKGSQANLSKLPQATGWRRIVDALDRPVTPASTYLTRRALFAPHEVRSLMQPELYAAGVQTLDLAEWVMAQTGRAANERDSISANWISRAELRVYTHNQLLHDTDVMSMAHSLEVRVPLLDVPLLETVLALPEAYLTSPAHQPKQLLNDAIGHLLPDLVRQRQDKQGFVLPFGPWLAGPLAKRTREALAEVAESGWLQPAAIEAVYTDFQAGKVDWSRLWAVVALASCLRE